MEFIKLTNVVFKHMKRYSASLIIRATPMKTTLKWQSSPMKLAKISKVGNTFSCIAGGHAK